MPRSIRRCVALTLGAGLLLTASGLVSAVEPRVAVAAPSTTTNAAERSAVQGFYAAQSFTSPAKRAVLELPRTVRMASNAKVDYFHNFYDAYAENPDVEVRSMNVQSKVLKKKVTGDSIQYTVSVSVEFRFVRPRGQTAVHGW